ncbi:MAG: hypothetical protein SV487_02350 [Thermodesulfobacteriota bacterium]|nr:hypothetical protein [Thermodesulfobacteriota bacterium]
MDRRKKVDPRYRNPNYQGFVERRSGSERRKHLPAAGHSVLSEHGPRRKILVIIGTVAVLLLLYFFSLTCYHILGVPSATSREPKENVSPVIAF